MMTTPDHRPHRAGPVLARGQFLKAMSAAGTAIALAGPAALAGAASATGTAPTCAASVQDVLNMALTLERAMTTFYYTGLTSRAIIRHPRLADACATPKAASCAGRSAPLANLHAALDQEQKHTQILTNAGATSRFTRFHFPASAFQSLGYTSHAGTFLWLLDHLETDCIAFYLAAVEYLGLLNQPDLAVLAVRHLAVECEHRALGRVTAGDDPSDNLTLPVVQFACLGDALQIVQPYLTGQGFRADVSLTQAIALPTAAQTARVIGQDTST